MGGASLLPPPRAGLPLCMFFFFFFFFLILLRIFYLFWFMHVCYVYVCLMGAKRFSMILSFAYVFPSLIYVCVSYGGSKKASKFGMI